MQLNASLSIPWMLDAHIGTEQSLRASGRKWEVGSRSYPSQALKTIAMKSCDEAITVLPAYQSP